MSADDFGTDRFDLFLAAGVMCQMPPTLSAAVLKHVGKFCDEVLMWEYLLNVDGRLSADDAVVFSLSSEHRHLLFLNPYRQQLAEAGYGRVELAMSEIVHAGQVPEEGALWARKGPG